MTDPPLTASEDANPSDVPSSAAIEPTYPDVSCGTNAPQRERWQALGGAVLASLAVHLAAALLMIFGLPTLPMAPAREEAIKVSLVPPPKPGARKPPDARRAAPSRPEAPKSDATKPLAQAPQPKEPAQPKEKATRQEAVPVTAPVFRFGPRDSGPKRSTQGGAATGSEAKAESEPPARIEPTSPADKPTGTPAVTAQLEPARKAPVSTVPPPKPQPEPARSSAREPQLHEARKLYSASANGSVESTRAMGRIPRDVRAGELCVSELRDQLLNADPPFLPDLLPQTRLKEGTVIEIRNNAFRSFGQWFELSYRCEIDPEATKVLSFAYRVGDPIPRSQWARRGFPKQ